MSGRNRRTPAGDRSGSSSSFRTGSIQRLRTGAWRSPSIRRTGDFAIGRLPERIAAFADERGYLPLGTPLVKRVGTVAGQNVCMIADRLYIDGLLATIARTSDGSGRALTP